MTGKRTGILVFCVLFLALAFRSVTAAGQGRISLLFYNTENFFDPFDDTLTLDDAFTPAGERHWTFDRFRQKAVHLYKLFLAAGEHLSGWDPPALIALAEVENGYVLHYLLHETPFRKFDYGMVHYDSPDRRGIDVALLYDRKRVDVLRALPVSVILPGDSSFRTRDILYVLVRVGEVDTLALFLNHWPSRRGGYLSSEPYRRAASRVLAEVLDTLSAGCGAGKVIVAGDFNDEPRDPPVAAISGDPDAGKRLVNLMLPLQRAGQGSLYYDGRWWLFDQWMVSPALAGRVLSVEILRFPFLTDAERGGIPRRTYAGYRYLGGFSDHLPVALTLQKGAAGK